MENPVIATFHGTDEKKHEAFQVWRREHPNGFHMTESAAGRFTIHWAQDKRENAIGRGCTHQGVSTIRYREDKDGCYTTARKVCAESLADLLAWADARKLKTKSCGHCDTNRHPFPRAGRAA